MSDQNKWEELFDTSIKNLQIVWYELSKDHLNDNQDLEQQLKQLNAENSWLKELVEKTQYDLNQSERKNLEIETKYQDLQKETQIIVEEVEKSSKKMHDLTTREVGGTEMIEVFDMFLMLMENVFDTGPHVRLLLMLHSDKEVWTLKELTEKSGYSPVETQRAMRDLHNVNVVEYDEEQKEIRLIQQFL